MSHDLLPASSSPPSPAPAGPEASPDGVADSPSTSWRLRLGLVLLLGLATLALHAHALCFPTLLQDDFHILARSWTWSRAVDGLWEPNNEHVMPLGRLLTAALVSLAGRASAVPAVVIWVGPLGVLVALVLLYLLVVGETGRPIDALVACALVGVSSTYQQAVFWFAASFVVLALDTLLLALLACQLYRRTGRVLYLDLAVLACALAPGWFASGVLAGPLCCVYLFLRERPGSFLPPRSFTLLPLAGTALFLALALPRAGSHIMHLEHYAGQTAIEAFHPLVGLGYTARSVIDNLFLGLLGISSIEVPLAGVAVAWLVLAGLAAWYWRSARHPRLLLLGLALVLTSYWLTYSARALWGYDGVFTRTNWSRYHLLPQVGLALFLAGGLARGASADSSSLTRRQACWVALLIVLCLLIQLPRGLLGSMPADATLPPLLRQIDEMDQRCRHSRVSAEQARQALPPLDLTPWFSSVNGWEFLRGSDAPLPHTPEEVRHLLEP